MRIVITGATGQVGSALRVHFKKSGHEVVGLVRHMPGNGIGGEWLQADIGDWRSVQQAITRLDGCDAVIHAAADIRPTADAADYTHTNALGTVHVIEAAKRWGAGHFTFISSLSVIGRPRQIPVDETHPIGPVNLYGHSKYFGEGVALHSGSASLKTCAMRISSPVGAGTSPERIFGLFVRRALHNERLVLNGRGGRRQNFVDVRDIALAVDRGLKRRAAGVFNIGGRHAVSNHELAKACVRTLRSGSSIEYSGTPDPDENLAWELSIEKAARNLGYAPKFSIEDSIKQYADECSDSI